MASSKYRRGAEPLTEAEIADLEADYTAFNSIHGAPAYVRDAARLLATVRALQARLAAPPEPRGVPAEVREAAWRVGSILERDPADGMTCADWILSLPQPPAPEGEEGGE